MIGDLLEASIEPLLREFADKHGLYLDTKGVRPARRRTKCTWLDVYGNAHDLDYVLERGGTAASIGVPVAFIETAWRRYTKHSRNKAQEIQGAILPLFATHKYSAPFMGAILAGVFTDGALTQMRSLGFKVLYFEFATVIEAFKRFGIDAYFAEKTPDAELAEKVAAWSTSTPETKREIARTLVELNASEVGVFMQALESAIARTIERVVVLPLHGVEHGCINVGEAIAFIDGYAHLGGEAGPTIRYEIEVIFSNGDRIEGTFADKDSAIEFLRTYESPPVHPVTD